MKHRKTEIVGCDHGVTFDLETAEAENPSAEGVRLRWPRLHGLCPKGCGYQGIAYASFEHLVYGDW